MEIASDIRTKKEKFLIFFGQSQVGKLGKQKTRQKEKNRDGWMKWESVIKGITLC